MKRHILIKALREELTRLNAEIDLKIIKGLSYKREALRHKFLSTQLRSLTRSTNSQWLQKTAKLLATFVF